MEPNDASLCIVTSSDAAIERAFLPFEEDGAPLVALP
jgi:hypothetical protein